MTENSKLNLNQVKKLKDNVYKFLEKYKVTGGPETKFTHVSMGDSFFGKFNLDKKAYKEFLEYYCEAVNYGVVFSIAEKPKDYGPILIDIDMELPIDDYNNGRLYNINIIFEIINAYREGLKTFLELGDDELIVTLHEKEQPTKKATVLKDGFHLIFNNICAHYKVRHLVRDYVIKKLEETDIFNNFSNSVDKIIDKAVVNTNCWLMYGSKKNDGQIYTYH
jgi:hypothetical protein